MFTKSSFNKVKFQDPQLDDYVLENSVLQSRLQSKNDALTIMSKELDKCSMERDRYKVLVEQLKCKQIVPLKTHDSPSNMYRLTPTNTISGGDMLTKTKDHNNILMLEVEMLRSKLDEATGDIVALRKQLQRKESFEEFTGNTKSANTFTCSNVDYEQLVQDLEKVKKKYQQIQLDYRATLDEKEELVSDRDYYKNKVQRLNHQISYILSNKGKTQQADDGMDNPKPIVDIDALVTENKYLNERITQLQIEKELVKRTLTKYKTILANRNKNGLLHNKMGFIDFMTRKQAREFLDNSIKMGGKQSSVTEMKSLCLGLFEALNDKSTALQHQRKTNQILANRITELEKTLESWCNGQKCIPIFPSQMLLDELIPETESAKYNETKDKILLESRDNNQDNYSDSDDDNKEDSDTSSDTEKNRDTSQLFTYENRSMTKTVLPLELEELVQEALAELKTTD